MLTSTKATSPGTRSKAPGKVSTKAQEAFGKATAEFFKDAAIRQCLPPSVLAAHAQWEFEALVREARFDEVGQILKGAAKAQDQETIVESCLQGLLQRHSAQRDKAGTDVPDSCLDLEVCALLRACVKVTDSENPNFVMAARDLICFS